MGVTALSGAVCVHSVDGGSARSSLLPRCWGGAAVRVGRGNLSHPLSRAPSPELASGFPGNPPRASSEARHIGSTETPGCRGQRGRTTSRHTPPSTNTQNALSLPSPTICSSEKFPSQAGTRGKLSHDPLPSSLPHTLSVTRATKVWGSTTDHKHRKLDRSSGPGLLHTHLHTHSHSHERGRRRKRRSKRNE